MIRRVMQRFLREENGIALVLAIAAMSVLAITTTGVIVAGTSNESTAYVSMEGRSAFAVAQQALAYGEGMVYGDVEATPAVTPPTTVQNLPTQPNGATGTYVVSTSNGQTWHIVATGTMTGVTRTVSVDVTPTQSVTTQNYALWNYLYIDATSCVGATISGGTTVSMPILARGDLCVQGSSTSLLNTVEVGGNLSFTGNPKIGTSASPIPKLEVVGSCVGVTPGTGNCDGHSNNIYASTVGRTLDTTTQMPTVDFTAAYNTQAALTKNGCPANLFDTDSTANNGYARDVSSIMFGSSYDCFVGTNEIRWTSSTNSLYVHGTLYIDGSLTHMSNLTYTGQASLYFSGGATFQNDTFCGIASCTQSWNPNQNLIAIVADCLGIASNKPCVQVTGGANIQVAAYVNGEYDSTGNGGNMGPVMCRTDKITGGTNLLIPFTTYPAGLPTTSTTSTVTGTPPTSRVPHLLGVLGRS